MLIYVEVNYCNNYVIYLLTGGIKCELQTKTISEKLFMIESNIRNINNLRLWLLFLTMFAEYFTHKIILFYDVK